jgi:hypothetical protein
MPSSFSRKVRRHFLGATRISGDARWIVHGPVRGSTIRDGISKSRVRVKASEGAEKSCLPRRRKRGLRTGSRRSRVGKTRRSGNVRPPDPCEMRRRRVLRRDLRELKWASARVTFVLSKTIVPARKARPDKWRCSKQLWDRVDRLWSPLKRQVSQMSSLGPISVKSGLEFIDGQIPILVDSWNEVGFGSPYCTPREWAYSRALRRPTIEDLFPDSGPISRQEYERKRILRLNRVTRCVVPCRCRGYHRYCDDCGACIYAGSSCHRPRRSERR